MAETPGRRCPNCGALVGEDAEWCGQCFTDLRAPRATGEALPSVRVPVTGARPGPSNGHEATVSTSTEPTPVGWPCAACGRRNPMEVDACLACGTPFGRGFETPGEGPSISPRSAIRWSLLYPGLGHFRARRGIDGLARAVVFTWPLLTGIAFLSLRPKGGFGAVGMLGTAFVLCAALFYAVAALDAGRAANGDDPLVSSRMLLWIAAVLVLSSVVSAAVIAGQGITTLRNR